MTALFFGVAIVYLDEQVKRRGKVRSAKIEKFSSSGVVTVWAAKTCNRVCNEAVRCLCLLGGRIEEGRSVILTTGHT